MMRYLFIVLLCSSFVSFSQLQVFENGGVIYNNYLENIADVSPKNIEVGVVGGVQKNQLLNSQTQSFFIHSPIRHQQIGIGLALANRNSLLQKDQELRVSGNYNLLIAGDTLSFGLGAQYIQQKYSLDGLYINNETDEIVLKSNLTNSFADFSTGVVFSPNKYRFSFSIKNLMSFKSSSTNLGWWGLWGLRSFNINDGFTIQGGVKMERYNARSLLYTLFMNNEIGNAFSVGAGYRTNKSLFVQLTVKMNSVIKVYDPMMFGYEYIGNLSGDVIHNPIIHKVFLNYTFRKPVSYKKLIKYGEGEISE